MWVVKEKREEPARPPRFYQNWEISPELVGPSVRLYLQKESDECYSTFNMCLSTSPYISYGFHERIYCLEDLDNCLVFSQLEDLDERIMKVERELTSLKDLRSAYGVFTSAIPQLKEILKSEGME